VGRTFQKVRLFSVAAPAEAEASPVLLPQAPKVTRLPNGVTVASIENYSPLSRIALVANAGSRFEDGDNLGVTHCLRVASGLTTQKSTGFNLTRTIEQAGADYTCSATREYMFYKVDCLRNNLELAASTLAAATTAPTFKPWELADAQSQLVLDLAALKTQPNVLAFDLLHAAAFRDTLGRSLYAPQHMLGKYQPEQLLHYMKANYTGGRVALVGVGVDHDALVAQARQMAPFAGAAAAADKAVYHGGEIRVETGGEMTYAAVAVEGPSLSGSDLLQAAVLQNVLGVGPSIKYSAGTASSKLIQAAGAATASPFALSSINANYTDNGLFGFFAVAQAREIEKVLRAAFNEMQNVAQKGVAEEDVARAKVQLKAQIGMYRESGDSLLHDLGEQALGSDELLTTPDLLKYVDSITTADVSAMAKKLAAGKLSMSAVGNLSRTPYVDSLKQ